MDRHLTVSLPAPSFEGNLVGELSTRAALVSLPRGYWTSTARYPVLILLHGFGTNAARQHFWRGAGYCPKLDIVSCQARLEERRAIEPMIVVCPDGGTPLGGGMWEDSPVSGRAASFIVDDLIPYIDARFRTRAVPEQRAIAGHSMGGQGAVRIAMRHPGVFGVVCSMSGMMAFSPAELLRYAAHWHDCDAARQRPEQLDEMSAAYAAMCMAFCARPGTPPWHVCFPARATHGVVRLDEEACQEFLSKWPEPNVPREAAALSALAGLLLTVGTDDEFVWGLESNRRFVGALQRHGVPFHYREYLGDHTSHVADQLESVVLPFVSHGFARRR